MCLSHRFRTRDGKTVHAQWEHCESTVKKSKAKGSGPKGPGPLFCLETGEAAESGEAGRRGCFLRLGPFLVCQVPEVQQSEHALERWIIPAFAGTLPKARAPSGFSRSSWRLYGNLPIAKGKFPSWLAVSGVTETHLGETANTSSVKTSQSGCQPTGHCPTR